MNETQDKTARRAALLEEDDNSSPTPAPNRATVTKPNSKANGHATVTAIICPKCDINEATHTGYCADCWLRVGCIKCHAKERINSIHCEDCAKLPKPWDAGKDPVKLAGARALNVSDMAGICKKCQTKFYDKQKNVPFCDDCQKTCLLCGAERKEDVPMCEACWAKQNTETRKRWKKAMKWQCTVCGERPALENGVCYQCSLHMPTKMKKQANLPTEAEWAECLYGWVGEYAKMLGCPLSAAYPAALAVAAGYGVPADPRVRTNLYVNILGVTRAGKSVTTNRAVKSWTCPATSQLVKAYPGSEIGLVQILGGKKVKDGEDIDPPKPTLLVQDEMRNTFGKIAIQNSSLPHALNQLFYEDVFETAAKGGHWAVSTKLSILGCLTCANPDEFAEIYGADTATGFYGRMIFGYVQKGWNFNFATWQPPFSAGDTSEFRRPLACSVTAEAFRMVEDWANVDLETRADLKELALRVALITSSMNHDPSVTTECVSKALKLMELQVRIRDKYRPSEMDTPVGRCQQAIIRALKHYEEWVEWRVLCQRHSLYHGKDRNAEILNRTYRAMVFQGLLEEESKENGNGEMKKTGRVRLVTHQPATHNPPTESDN